MMGKEKKKKLPSSSSKDNGDFVKVYLRFRPKDKLEASKRSKDCVQLHENPKLVTVDSPLQGTFDFTFDQVRSEYRISSQSCNAPLSQNLSIILVALPRPGL
jgi:hypothetical protein